MLFSLFSLGILEANSWHVILDTFQKSEALYSKFRLPKNNQEIFEKENNINSDLQILSSALDNLFTNSSQYSVISFDFPQFHLIL